MKRVIRRSRRKERGFALFLVLLVLLVITISGIALLFNTQMEQSLSSTETKISKAFYAADSGIEYATEQLRTNVFNYKGGALPVSMSANYTGQAADIAVNVTTPLFVGYSIHHGDQIISQGGTYGTNQTIEAFYHMTSTATSVSIQAQKAITTDVGIYPQQLGIHP